MEEATTRRRAMAGVAGVPAAAAGAWAMAACGPLPGSGSRATGSDLSSLQQKVLVWGPTGNSVAADRQAQIEVWNRRYPNLSAEIVPAPFTSAQGIEALQKLFASVAAGDPPDVVYLDRFQISNLAARKTVASIDQYVKRDKYDLKRHYVALLEEVTGIDGKTYALPSTTDNRAIVWNKRLLREAGVNFEKGPQTWDELRQFAVRATRATGEAITQLGWDFKQPGFGILYLWSWLAGAQFLSRDGRTAQYNHPGVIEALEFLLSAADAQGGTQRVDAYIAAAGTGAGAFANERYALLVGNSAGIVSTVMRQRPEMEFGVAQVPVRRAGDKGQTFAGGFSWATPQGTRNPEVSWAVLRSLMSEEALQAAVEVQANTARASGAVFLPTPLTTVQEVDRAIRQKYATGIPAVDAAWDFTLNLMSVAKVRPVSPAAAEAWDALSETWNNVLARRQTPKAACDAMNARVQKALDDAYAAAGLKK